MTHRFTHNFRKFFTDLVTTWNAGQKMSFFMLLMSVEVINYITWMLFIKNSSYAQQFVNIDIINTLFNWALISIVIIFLSSYLFYRYQGNEKFVLVFQPIIMIIYTFAAGYIGYLVGQDNIMSATAISTAGLLIVLFCDRIYAVWVLLLNLVIMFAVMYGSKTGILPSPNFYIGNTDNVFWVFSYFQLCAVKVLVILLIADNILYVLKESYQKSKFLSEHDVLTKLPNRTTILAHLLKHLDHKKSIALVIIDLDYFKQVNDNFGHLFGDKVLVQAAKLLTSHLRQDEMLSRYGGEEFLLVLPDATLDQATTVAKRLHSVFNTLSISIDNESTLKPTASFGVAASDHLASINQTNTANVKSNSSFFDAGSGPEHLKQLFELADKAMYRAKQNGRNQVVSAKDLVVTHKDTQAQSDAKAPLTNLRIIYH